MTLAADNGIGQVRGVRWWDDMAGMVKLWRSSVLSWKRRYGCGCCPFSLDLVSESVCPGISDW
jgi:hypothetical protein